MNVRKYDYLINENGDIWMVDRVYRDGDVTITFTGGGGGEDDTLTYSAGQIESWFRKLPKKDFSDRLNGYLDPAPYWKPEPKPAKFKVSKSKSKRKAAKGQLTLGGMR